MLAFRLKLLGILLGIPLIGIATAITIQGMQDDGFRQSLREEVLRVRSQQKLAAATTTERMKEEGFRKNIREQVLQAPPQVEPINEETLARATVRYACADLEFRGANPEACGTNDMFRWALIVSAVSGILALSLFVGITVAGRTTFRDRDHLLRIFVPGFKITGYAASFLALVYAVLFTGVVFLVESQVFGFIHTFLLLGILGGGAVASFACWNAVRTMLSPRQGMFYYSKTAAAGDAPALWRSIAAVASKVGAELPTHVVLGIDGNFFVTEGEVGTLDGPVKGRVLYLSLPLCRLLKHDELEAVIAHELAHFVGHDTEYGVKYGPIYTGIISSYVEMSAGGIAAIPVQMLMGYFWESFSTAVAVIDRERELAADGVGARTVSPRAIASSLLKLHIYGPLLDPLRGELREAVFDEKPIPKPREVFARRVADHAAARSTDDLDERRLPHPTDSHPQLSVRLKSLLLEIKDVEGEAFEVPPSTSALALIPQADALEQTIWKAIEDAAVNDFAGFKTTAPAG